MKLNKSIIYQRNANRQFLSLGLMMQMQNFHYL